MQSDNSAKIHILVYCNLNKVVKTLTEDKSSALFNNLKHLFTR